VNCMCQFMLLLCTFKVEPFDVETSNEGCNARPTWHDFTDNFNVWIKLYQTKKIPLGMNKCNGSIGGCKQQTKVCPNFFVKWYQSILILHTYWNRIYHINIGHDPCCGLTTKFGAKKNASWENVPRLKEMGPEHFQVKSILGVIIQHESWIFGTKVHVINVIQIMPLIYDWKGLE
jgi:hypothetical protein